MSNMLRVGKTVIALSKGMKAKVSNYALHGGGIYRMNTVGASYYSFTPFKDDKGKSDFCGGHDWLHTALDTHFAYVYDMSKNKFYTKAVFNKLHKHETN